MRIVTTVAAAALCLSCSNGGDAIDGALAENTLPAANAETVTLGLRDMTFECRDDVARDISGEDIRQVLRRTLGVEVEEPASVLVAERFPDETDLLLLFDAARLYLSADEQRAAAVVIDAQTHEVRTFGMVPVEALSCS